MSSRVRSAGLWGAVGALAFLVLAQGYRLVVGPIGLGIGSAAAVAVVVAAVTGVAAYVTENRLTEKGRT